MPGFFDIIFGQSEPEPEAPKPKKVKKVKKAKKSEEDPRVIESLRAEVKVLRAAAKTPKPEPEPEPEVDESRRDPRGYQMGVKEDSDGEDESD